MLKAREYGLAHQEVADVELDELRSCRQLTRGVIVEAMPGMDRMFDRVDDNSDGAITTEEMDAMQARMARMSETIATGEGTENREAGEQYRILEAFLNN